MACSAITSKLKDCRNWSCLDGKFCSSHKNMAPQVLTQRWIKRFILRYDSYTVFNRKDEARILSDLTSGTIVLTPGDILKIPARDRYTDIYLFFIEHGFVEKGAHKNLELNILNFYTRMIANYAQDHSLAPVRDLIERTMIVSSGKTLFDFLMWIGPSLTNREHTTRKMIEYIPSLLDTSAAKELSWYTRDELDKLRIHYEKAPGKEHLVTKCLVQRWLLDIKELYHTEKTIQKLKMDHCKEELMMNRWHPDRLNKYLEMGYEIDQLDDIM